MSTVLLTGGVGFIGSHVLLKLNHLGVSPIVVDCFGKGEPKWKTISTGTFEIFYPKTSFYTDLAQGQVSFPHVEAVIHLGACSATTERDVDYLERNNLWASQLLFSFCRRARIPFLYASSAATYGDGSLGFRDDHSLLPNLKPLNGYAQMKHWFDRWVLSQKEHPPFWAGFKFFNVYGPGERHKGDMQSLVSKAVPQILETQKLKLFQGHRPQMENGAQKRDFVFVQDVVDVLMHFLKTRPASAPSGIYNVGTGQARSFRDLGSAVFKSLNKTENFDWVPMPEALKKQYQDFTQADVSKLRTQGLYTKPFTALEEGVALTVNQDES